MKKLITGFLALAIIAFFAFKGGDEKHVDLALGKKAPKSELKMKSTNGDMTSLNGVKGENGSFVSFLPTGAL